MRAPSNPFVEKPHTKLGRWAVSLGTAFLVMFLINTFVFMPTSSDAPWRHVILPFYGMLMLLCGLASGICGFAALMRLHERSWMVMLTLPPALWVLIMLAGELLVPH